MLTYIFLQSQLNTGGNMSDGYLSFFQKSCATCEGKGFVVRQPGPLVTDLDAVALNYSKDSKVTVEELNKIAEKQSGHIVNITDKVLHLQCSNCAGLGIIANHLSLNVIG